MTLGYKDCVMGTAVLERARLLHLTVVNEKTGHRKYKTIRVWEAGTDRPALNWKQMYEFRRQGRRVYLSPNFIMLDDKQKKVFDTGYSWSIEYVEATGFAVNAARMKANAHL